MNNLKYLPLLFPLLLSCATAPAPVPEWAARGVDQAFPLGGYIAQEGRGQSREAAETNAMAALSRYFAAQVETSARNIQSMIRGGESFARSDTSASIQSSTSLFAVRYAAPWYNSAEKTWLTAAYINREEAWAIFEPRIQQTAGSFMSAYSAAGEEQEALKQVFMYGAALGAAEVFIRDLNFAQALNPSKTGQFDDTRAALAQINVLMDRSKSESPVFIDCQDPTLKTALSNAFSSGGIPVSREREQANYVCKVDIEENIQTTDAGTM
jgi:hypothetical protein